MGIHFLSTGVAHPTLVAHTHPASRRHLIWELTLKKSLEISMQFDRVLLSFSI